MNINPYKMMRAYIDKKGMVKLYVPDIIKDSVKPEIDDYQLKITIQ